MSDYVFLVEDIAKDTNDWYILKECCDEDDALVKFFKKFIPYIDMTPSEAIEMFRDSEIIIRVFNFNDIKTL